MLSAFLGKDLDTRVTTLESSSGSGSVTSVGLTVPTGLSVSGSPITGAGTFAISFASGYSIPTTAKQAQWDAMQGQQHTHANKPILDQITQSNIDVLAKLSIVDGNIKVDTTLWATGGISALGLGSGGGGSGGGVDMLDAWANYTTDKANYYAPASLLVPFRNDTLSRLTSLESGSATSIETTGSGNAITSLTKAGSVITANKGLSFALSSHTHTIAQITGLQGALDSKASLTDLSTAIDGIEIGGRNLILDSGFTSTNGWRAITGSILGVDNGELSFSGGGGSGGWRALMSSTDNLISLEAGSFYTLSYQLMFTGSEVMKSDVVLGFSRYGLPNSGMDGASINFNVRNQIDPDVVNEWQTIKTTVQATHDVPTSVYLRFGTQAFGEIKIRRVKVEKGTIATDWSPAPEDQVSNWSTSDATSFSFIKNKPTQLSQFTDNIGVASHIANKANPHAVTTAQIGAVDLISNQNIGGVKSFTNNVTAPTFIGALSGNASSATTSDMLTVIDSRSVTDLPENITNRRITAFFKTNAIVNDPPVTTGSSFAHILNMNGYNSGNVGNGGHTTQLAFGDSLAIRQSTSTTAWGAWTRLALVTDNVASATKLQTARTIWGQSFNGEGNVLGALTGATTGSFSSSVSTPKVDFGNGFTIEPSGTELVFKYNGVIKQRMLSDGTILATGGITALAT